MRIREAKNGNVSGNGSTQALMMRKRALLILAGATAGLFNHATHAASITWGSPAGIGAATTMGPDSDVLSTGTGNYAYDWNNVATTVNGVAFAGTNSGGSVGGGNVTVSNFSGNYNGFGNSGNVPGRISAAYYNATAGGEYANAVTVTISLNNLTSGHFYAVETWVDDGRNANLASRTETINSTGGGNTVTLQYGDTSGGVGQYAIGDFVAGGTSQSYTMTSGTSTQINALQLRDITACWTGQNSATWDNNTVNFTNSQSFASAKTILNGVFFGDTDGFNNTITNNNITIQSGGVQTGTVTFVNMNLAYTFNSASDNLGITGSTAVVVNGAGTVNFAGANTYSGATTINAGVLQFDKTAAVNNNTVVTVNSGGTLAVNAGGTGEFVNASSGAGSIGSVLTNPKNVFTAGSSLGIDTTNAGSSLNYAGNISGLEGINKLGSNDLTLSGSNAYSGPTTVTAGTLTAGSTFAFGTNSAVVLLNTNTANSGFNLLLNNFSNSVGSLTGGGTSGGWIDLGSATLTVGGSASPAAYAGFIQGSGSIVKTGTGTLTLSGQSIYSGGTTLNAGTLVIAANSAANASQGPVGTGTLTLSGGTLTNAGGLTLANPIAVTASATTTVIANGSGNFALSGAVTGSGTILVSTALASSLYIQGDLSGFTGTFNYNDIYDGNNFTFNGTGTNSYDAANVHFVLSGPTANYRGLGFYIDSGAGSTFQMGDLSGTGGQIGSHTSSTSGVGTLQIGSLNDSPGPFSGVITNDFFGTGFTVTTAVTKVGTGTLDLAGSNNYTGGTNINGGVLKVDIAQGSTTGPLGGGSGSLPSGTITFGGGTLQYSSGNNTDYSSVFATTAQPVQIDTNGRAVTFTTPLMPGTNGSLLLNDTSAVHGSLTLPISDSYTGATTITGGTLILDHSGANTGALNSGTGGVSVGNGAKLLVKGSTSIAGSLSLAVGSAGVLDLRDGSINTLAIGGGLSVGSGSGGSTIDLDLGNATASNDALNVTGAVTETGSTTINLNLLSSLASGTTTYTLINATGGGLSAANFTLGSKPAGFNIFGLTTPTSNALLLSITSNPTPTVAYWTGKASSTGSPTDPNNNWGYGATLSTPKSNWSTTANGLTDPLQVPGAITDVFFTAANASSTSGALATQLDGAYSIKGLTFDTSAATPAISSVTLNTNGNTLTIGADGLTIAATDTSNTTISGSGAVLVGTSEKWANNSSSHSLTISAPISGTAVGATQVLTFNGVGSGGIVLGGAIGDGAGLNGHLALILNQSGITQLNGNNSFTGGVTLNGGVVQVGNAGALNAAAPNAVAFGPGSTGDLQLKGISLAVAGLSTNPTTVGTPVVENAAAGNATLTINNSSGTATYGGVLQNGTGGGTLSLTKTGAGTQVLSGSSNITGPTLISAGILSYQTPGSLAANSAITVASGGTAQIQNGLTSTLPITLSGPGATASGATGALESVSGNNVFAAPIVLGSAAIIASDANTLTLNGNINGSGFALAFAGAGNGAVPVTLNTTVGGVAQIGAGTWLLSGANTYTGPTIVTAGILQAGVASVPAVSGAFGNNSDVTVNAGTLDLNNLNTQIGSLAGGGAVTLEGATLTVAGSTSPAAFAGTISGTGAVIMTGTGTLTLSGASSTYSGGTHLTAGTLAVGASSTGGPGSVTAGPVGVGLITLGGGTFTDSATVTIDNAIVVTAATTTNLIGTGNNILLTGAITGSGTLQTNTSSAASVLINSDLSGFTGTFNFINVLNGNNLTFGYGANAPGSTSPSNYNASNVHFVLSGSTATGARGVGFYTGGTAGDTFQMGDLSGSGGVIGAHKPSNAAPGIGTLQIGSLNDNPGPFSGYITDDFFSASAFDGETTAVNKVGTGTLNLAGFNDYSGGTTVSAGTLTFSAPGALPNFSSLTILGGALANAANHGSGPKNALFASNLSIAGSTGAWTGTLDLANNDLVIQNGNLSQITNQLKQGYNGGAWNGNGGIVSTAAAADSKHLTALGVILNQTSSGSEVYSSGNNPANPFDGATQDSSSDVLIKYTYYGDANLDGKVDGSDYSLIDSAYLADQTNPGSVTGWYNGDFNYDGVVDGSDYTLMDNAFNTQGAQISAQLASPTSQISGGASVPEPTALCLLGLGTAGLLGRRRQK